MASVSVEENTSNKNDPGDKATSRIECNGIILCNSLKNGLNEEMLTVLKLNYLQLIDLPEELPDLINLYEINLSGNQLYHLPSKLISAKSLRILDLSKNKFRSVPNCLFLGLHALKRINFSENLLSEFNKPPACLPLLRELYLGHNLIEVFPQWILSDYVYLIDVLDLSFNPCFKLRKDFKAPANNRISGSVKTLKLKNTNFSIVSLGLLLYFPSLISLDLSSCPNSQLTEKNALFSLEEKYLPSTLEELHLQDTSLTFAPNIVSLKDLKTLNVSANSLYWWPTDDPLAPDLRYIDLHRTMLVNVPDCIGNLALLTHLMLSENEIAFLPTTFHLLCNLEVLDLYNNVMESMPELTSLIKLKGLDLWMNHFEPTFRPLAEEGPSYEDLKTTLRKTFGFQSRYDIAKEKSEDSSYSERSSTFCSTSPDTSFTMPEIPSATNPRKLEEEEENWDEQSNSDDWFDPTGDQTYKEEIYREIQSRDFGKNCLKYCPYEIQHSPHLFQPYLERNNSELWKKKRMLMEEKFPTAIVAGQFDDA